MFIFERRNKGDQSTWHQVLDVFGVESVPVFARKVHKFLHTPAQKTASNEEYLPSKYIPGGATYRARSVMEMPLSVEDVTEMRFVVAGWVHTPWFTVDKQSVQFYEGVNTNLHELHCYRGEKTQVVGLVDHGNRRRTGEVLLALTARYIHMTSLATLSKNSGLMR